jgi:sugar/nucleoside kinase (ribokinase family)
MAEIWAMGELLVEVMRPRRGMPLSQPGEFRGPFPSGATGIFIDTVARLGHSAAIVSGVGDDDFGKCILERFQRDGVDTGHLLVVPDKATGVAFVTYFEDGSRRFLYHWDHTPAVMARAPAASEIAGARFLHVMGCALMPNAAFRAEVFKAVRRFARAGAKISFDPNVRPELLSGRSVSGLIGPVLGSCSVLLPGERELQLLSGLEDIDAGAVRLLERPPMQAIVVKRGSRGCTVYSRDGKVDVPSYRVPEVDPTGAGDCFDAGFLCGMLENLSLEECARTGAAAGALNAAAFGPMEGDISRETIRCLRAAGPG